MAAEASVTSARAAILRANWAENMASPYAGSVFRAALPGGSFQTFRSLTTTAHPERRMPEARAVLVLKDFHHRTLRASVAPCRRRGVTGSERAWLRLGDGAGGGVGQPVELGQEST